MIKGHRVPHTLVLSTCIIMCIQTCRHDLVDQVMLKVTTKKNVIEREDSLIKKTLLCTVFW